MKTFDEIVETLGATEIKNFAFAQKKVLTKEFKKIVNNMKHVDLESIAELPAVEALKDNLTNAMNKVQDNEVFEYAKNKVADTKKTVLSVLNIPTNDDVESLTRKLASLEKKLQSLSRHSK